MGISQGPGVLRGRPFANGNPGRQRGSRNKSTRISAALLEDERPELLRIAIDIAKRGNVPMLKFFLARLLPRERLVTIDLPDIVSASDASKRFDRFCARCQRARLVLPRELLSER